MPNVQLMLPKLHTKQKRIVKKRKEKYNVICAGTKFGKTLGESVRIAAPLFAADFPMQALWGAPYYNNAKVAFKYMQALIHPNLRTINKAEMSLTFKHNGATIFYKGLNHDPEAAEGDHYHIVVLDEVSKMKPECIVSVRTTTTQTKAPIDLISTPRGRNHFHQSFLKGMDANNSDYAAYKFKTADNPNISKKEIAIARRELPDRLFRQYYLAEFVDDSELFVGYADCIMDMDEIRFRSKERQYWVCTTAKEKRVVIGIDWAKSQDYTVFIAISYEEKVPRTVGFMRHNKLRYTDSLRYLQNFCKRFKEVTMIFHDKTGVGDALDDLLEQTRLPYEGKVFTNRSKGAWVNNLIVGVEQQALLLPNWTEMKNEFEGYEVTATPSGAYKYEATSGHDDIVSALLLAWEATSEFANIDLEVKTLENLPEDEEPSPEPDQAAVEEMNEFEAILI